METRDELNRANGYLLCYNDVLKNLIDMMTHDNTELIVELKDRIVHDYNMRELTGFLPDKN